ncbi:MAG: helicase-associated domain-containing protein [Candidatus Sumerlaeaceae bacterium]|nr:helicase-associated domain-containing protein [Candidatus Sumerlaeaceae bacterium]
MQLKAVLESLDEAALAEIAEFWGFSVPAEHGGGLMDYLYPRLQTARYLRMAVDRLPADQREILHFIAAHGGAMSRRELAERCAGGDEDFIAEALQALRRRGFVFPAPRPDHHLLCIPDTFLELLVLPPHMTGHLGGLLARMTLQDLHDVATALLGDQAVSLPRHHLVDSVRVRVLDPEWLENHIANLPPEEHRLFQTLLDRGGHALYRELLESDLSKRPDHARCEQLNTLIAKRGLVFVASEGANKYANLLVIPRDVLHVVRSGYKPDLRSPAQLDGMTAGSGEFWPSASHDNSQLILRDLVILASRLGAGTIKALSGGRISKHDLKRLVPPGNHGKSVDYYAFLAACLIARGHVSGDDGRWTLTGRLEESLSNPQGLFEDVFNWWVHTHDWSEDGDTGDAGSAKASRALDIIQLRYLVLKHLSGIPADRWVSTDAFLKELTPRLQAAGARRSRMPARLANSLLSIATRSLVWLGLLTSAQESEGEEGDEPGLQGPERPGTPVAPEVDAVRLTVLGRALLDRISFEKGRVVTDLASDELPFFHAARWIVVQPNHEILAPPDLDLSLLHRLSRFCEIRSVDVMSTFEITRESVQAALDAGEDADRLLEFLTDLSRAPVPETVVQMLRDCAVRHGEVRVRAVGGCIMADDGAVLAEVKASRRLAPQIVGQAGPSALLLAPDTDLERVARELRALGLSPRLESATVQAGAGDRFHLALTPEEMLHAIAAIRLLTVIEEELEVDFGKGRAAALARKMTPEAAQLGSFASLMEATTNVYAKKFRAALEERIASVEGRFKKDVARLVGKTLTGRGPSRFHYTGVNPAVERKDVVALLQFACDHELEVEMLYLKKGDREAQVNVLPRSFEGSRVYAHCLESDTDAMYALDRILRARLV